MARATQELLSSRDFLLRQLTVDSNRIANYLQSLGIQRGESVLLMMGNIVPLWQTTLALMKLGAVMIPAAPPLTGQELAERLVRAQVRFVMHKIENAAHCSETFVPSAPTRASDPLLLYFTSGTTAKPKLVLHSQVTYPIGQRSWKVRLREIVGRCVQVLRSSDQPLRIGERPDQASDGRRGCGGCRHRIRADWRCPRPSWPSYRALPRISRQPGPYGNRCARGARGEFEWLEQDFE